MKKSSHYLSDPKLTFRIREYLEAGNKKYVGVDSVVEHLQSVFSEYGRKKKTVFRKSVEKAYRIVCQELAIPDTAKTNSRDTGQETTFKKRKTNQDDGESSDSLSFSDDNEAYMDYKDANAVNNLMSDMYKKSNKRGAHSAPVSAASSPKRPDTANQAPDLCKTLFVIDRSGNNKKEQIANSNLSLTESLTSSTPKGFRKNSSDVSESIGGKNRTLYSVDEDEMVDSTSMISPVDVDKSMRGKQQLKTTKDDDLSIKSSSAAPSAKKKKKTGDKETKKKGPEVQVSSVTFADVGGNETALKEVCKLLVHMKHPEVYRQLGVTPPRGFLLHGPPGCGKTLLANAIAGELQLPYIKLAATEVVSGVSGESEEKLRDIFDKAVQSAPCILFIDEIDSITQKRENASKDMERRIVAQLLSCMDDLNSKPDIQVLVIGATNRADSLDPALRRAGRFDREICMGIPGETARLRILEVLCRGLRLNETFDYHHLAKQTPGFVGADLMALAREAAIIAVNRVFNRLQSKNTCLLEHSTNKNNEKVKESELSTPCVHSSTDSTNVPHEFVLNKLNSDVHNRNIDDTSKHKHLDDRVNHTQIAMDSSVELKPVFEANNCMEVDDSQPNLQKETQGESSSTRRDIVHSCGSGTSEKQTANLDGDFKLVLNWLKDEPPLSEEELRTLYITMLDFEEALKHVQPSAKREGFATIPDVTWDDIGALKDVREELEMAILAPVRHPEQFQSLGLTNPPGILLAGPPGCGKTLLAKAVANESGINFISVKGPELLNMYVGESERAVRQVFQRARNSVPCVIFFDELDALCPRRSGAGEGGSSVRVVNQLLTEMDGLEERKQVFIMGATNRPDIIDPAILRPGRLDKQLYVGLPVAQDRFDILNTLTKFGKKPKLSEDVDLKEIAFDDKCENFTGADLSALVREASVIALKQFMSTANHSPQNFVSVNKKHFQLALDKVKPSVSLQDLLVYMKMQQTLEVS